MIIGNGIIANAFKSYKLDHKIIIFASGVSNSRETSRIKFNRERDLLNDTLETYGEENKIVYFSTCSMYDTYFDISVYTEHKIRMENLVISKAKIYNIFRMSQVLGLNNRHQLIGFLCNSIIDGEEFELFNIERNIVDIDDIYRLVSSILNNKIYNNTIQNIANTKNIKVLDLVVLIEKILNKSANYKIVDKPGDFIIDIDNINNLIKDYKIFDKNYLESRIRKYYE